MIYKSNIYFKGVRMMFLLQIRLCIIFMLSAQLMAQYQGEVDIAARSQYNVSSERFFTNENGTILMNVNVWGHVNKPGRHMVFDGIDIATLLSVVGGPKGGAQLKKVKVFREVPDGNGELTYTINIAKFLNTGDRSEFVKIMPNDTFIIPQKTSSYMMEQEGTLNTLLSILNIYLQIDYRNNQ